MKVFDVTEFGASPVLGDNKVPFQRAINTARNNGGGAVYIPPGPFRSSQFTLYPKVALLGAGRNVTTLKQVSTDGDYKHFIRVAPDGGAQVSPTVAPYSVIKDMSIMGQRGGTDAIGRNGIHVANAKEDPNYKPGNHYRGVHIENVEVALCTGDGIYIGPGRSQSYVQFSRTTFNSKRGICINSANDCNIGPKVGSGSNDHHSLLMAAGSAPTVFNSQFWGPNDPKRNAVFFYQTPFLMVNGCMIEGDQNNTMRVMGSYGVPGAMLEHRPQAGNIVGSLFKNSGANPDQRSWIEVNNSPCLNVSNCNFTNRDGDALPDYVVYENDNTKGIASSVRLDSFYEIPGVRRSYEIDVSNNPSIIL